MTSLSLSHTHTQFTLEKRQLYLGLVQHISSHFPNVIYTRKCEWWTRRDFLSLQKNEKVLAVCDTPPCLGLISFLSSTSSTQMSSIYLK